MVPSGGLLLGGHVGRGARALGGRADQGGDAEVGDLHPPVAVHEDVLRLDVAVDHPVVVGELERLADLRHDRQRLGRLHAAVAQHVARLMMKQPRTIWSAVGRRFATQRSPDTLRHGLSTGSPWAA